MLKTLLKLALLLLAVVAITLGVLYQRYTAFLDAPLALETEQPLLVAPGSSLRQVASGLEQQGLLEDPLLLRIYGRLSGKAPRIKAGEYRIAPGTTPRALLDQLVQGEVVQYGLTLVEGWTFKDMLAAVRAHEALTHTLDGLDAAAIMAKLGAEDTHPEGWFLPETYHFPRGTTDLQFLRRAHEAMRAELEAQWRERADGLPLESPYEALILASIIERETAVPSERPQIAGVFVRRLDKGMRLQTDPTVIYGMGDAYQADIRYRDLRRDTPYNTYTRAGLPPTPIAMPSAAALHAALHPAPGDALYFVARGDGSHHFSATLAEHNRAVRQYQLGGSR